MEGSLDWAQPPGRDIEDLPQRGYLQNRRQQAKEKTPMSTLKSPDSTASRSPGLRAGFQPGLDAARPVNIFLGPFRKDPNASGIETPVRFRGALATFRLDRPAFLSLHVTKRVRSEERR